MMEKILSVFSSVTRRKQRPAYVAEDKAQTERQRLIETLDDIPANRANEVCKELIKGFH